MACRATLQNCTCAAPGGTLRWKAAYCLAKSQTDDLESKAVQSCLDEVDPVALKSLSLCEQNTEWKKRWCQLRREPGAAAQCVRSNEVHPIIERGYPWR